MCRCGNYLNELLANSSLLFVSRITVHFCVIYYFTLPFSRSLFALCNGLPDMSLNSWYVKTQYNGFKTCAKDWFHNSCYLPSPFPFSFAHLAESTSASLRTFTSCCIAPKVWNHYSLSLIVLHIATWSACSKTETRFLPMFRTPLKINAIKQFTLVVNRT